MQMATITAAPATPQTVPPAAPTPPTGTWQHPRLKEIEQRREAGIFTYTKLLHATVLLGFFLASFFHLGSGLRALLSLASIPPSLTTLTLNALRIILLLFASTSLRPLWAAQDEMSDIPLTPTQRKLLGLTPSSSTPLASPSAGGAYITPPRYARSSTPRSDSSRAAVAGSSPVGPGTPFGGSPLARKAMEGQGRRFSAGSFGAGSPAGSLFEESPRESVGSPSGRGASVGLNSKWLYQRGKSRVSGGLY